MNRSSYVATVVSVSLVMILSCFLCFKVIGQNDAQEGKGFGVAFLALFFLFAMTQVLSALSKTGANWFARPFLALEARGVKEPGFSICAYSSLIVPSLLCGIAAASYVNSAEVAFVRTTDRDVGVVSGPELFLSRVPVRPKTGALSLQLKLQAVDGGWKDVSFNQTYTLVPEKAIQVFKETGAVATPESIRDEMEGLMLQLKADEATSDRLNSMFAEILQKHGFKPT